jgi:glycerol-1-phosphate dehydrogenase [NAD(P)+]
MDLARMNAALSSASDTRSVVVGSGVLGSVPKVLAQCFGDQAVALIADENTYTAAGGVVERQLGAAGWRLADPILFPGAPELYADLDTVLQLEARLREQEGVPLAVGSGTLNDVTKLAAHRLGRAYAVVATAASMDGYAAFGAAITSNGFKQTVSCPAPRAVLADLDVLARAPAPMSSTGYGDLLGKVTAGADWILADTLEIEPIDTRAWSLVQESLGNWTGKPELLHGGDRAAIEDLFEGLVSSGIAMQICQSSRPASGVEHRFSHLWEMQALGYGYPAIAHGFKVGIGTIAGAALYERLLARDLTEIDIEARCRAWPSRGAVEQGVRAAHDLPVVAASAVEETLAKYIDEAQLHERLTLLRARWPALRRRLAVQLLPPGQIRGRLQAAGCPTEPEEIGISRPRLQASFALARTIRSRYTVLDLAVETGLLDELVQELFAPGGFWQ